MTHIESSLVVSDPCPCPDNCPTCATLVLAWPERPFTVNQANKSRWQWMAARAHWRDTFKLLAHGAPTFDWCTIVVDHELGTRRGVDVAACLPSVKAAIDGIVLAGTLPGDGPAHVRSVKFTAPIYTGRDALVLTLEGPLA